MFIGKKGFALIEAIVGLTIFSVVIALASQLTARGLKNPFVLERTEPWLTFMEEVNQEIQSLPRDDPLLKSGKRSDPFPRLSRPPDLKSFELKWQNCDLSEESSKGSQVCLVCGSDYRENSRSEIKKAFLYGLTGRGTKIAWSVYKKLPSENAD